MGMFERRAVDPHFLQFALNFFFDVLDQSFLFGHTLFIS